MKLATIDIGSNSIKLIVVDAAASDSFAVLVREKETVRLGRGTLREGYLSEAAMARAAACIKRFSSIAEARGAERIVAIATASVREAHNAAEFIALIEGETGVRIEVLSGIEEARLIGLAAAQGCAAESRVFLNIDIGGGSTEISLVRDGLPDALYSLRLGAVGLTERFITSDPAKPKEVRALREEVRAALERPARELRGVRWAQSTGTSGTILALGLAFRAERAETGALGAQPAGAEIDLEELETFNARIAGLDVAARRALAGISLQRAEIVVAGGQILEGVMRSLGIRRLRTCDWALREGVVIDQLRGLEAESLPPVPDLADQRLRGVHAVGRRFAYEEAHALQVARLAEKIFDALAPAFKLSRHQRLLLSAAALLHDVGYLIAHESHHKHSLYLIKQSELTGFSESERNVIANVARYHRAALPKPRHPDYAALNQTDRETVCSLSAILRVANALDRSHDARVEDVRCTIAEKTFQLELLSAQDCEKEMWAADMKRELFEQIFDCQLSLRRRAPDTAQLVTHTSTTSSLT